ncbi:flavin monoamine oxidase family protein [Kouleothrix sp.]|uniref:flavin monoamine oxidase family protein n=1 Tax=Kouleothrix sp. TaxID=2779161 RepID=UPI0039188B02
MDAEVVVVGAGAAGLAAARALADARRRAIVLEARGRVGGRVWTDYTFGPVPVERGAEFIHGEQADTWAWVRRAGAHTFAAARWAGRRIVLEDGRLVGPAVFEQRADLQPVFRLEEDIAAYDGPDISLGEWLRAHEFGALAAHIADVRLAHANCATPETISVAELAYELRFSDKGPGDFRILEGYDFVFAALAAGLDIRLNMPVSRVRWGVEGVEVQAGTGADARTFRARHAVITLPLAVLQAGAVEFDPPLPEAQRQAIGALVMPPAMKLSIRFDEIFWDADMTFLTGAGALPVWWAVRQGVPILTALSTGERAARVAAHGPDAVLEQGLAALAALFGDAPRRHYAAHMLVDWAADPWARGGYSLVRPGFHGMRAQLASPAGALHFAGEATVFANNPATVHGALHSGERAAREILGAL